MFKLEVYKNKQVFNQKQDLGACPHKTLETKRFLQIRKLAWLMHDIIEWSGYNRDKKFI